MKSQPSYLLPLFIISQFAGTSLWFVGNAILPELQQTLQLSKYAVSQVTTAVQFGFVVGTLVFALVSIADRYSPSRVFFFSTCIASLANVAIARFAKEVNSLLLLRFITGFFLAGIYPVGMKIAADWYQQGLGKALGYLVGALVLGTAFPHLLRNRHFDLPWETALYCTSIFALAGGLLILFSGDGPHRNKNISFSIRNAFGLFRLRKFRAAAGGYFGHMWELYTFWGFVPVIVSLYNSINNENLNIPLVSFLVIAVGSLSCIMGGHLSIHFGSKKVAGWALAFSGLSCIVSPFTFHLSAPWFCIFLIFWGLAVIADSPQFSTLVAQNSPAHSRGTALTFVTSIGFAITMLSLWVTDWLYHSNFLISGRYTFLVLAVGPLLGLFSMHQVKAEGKDVYA